MAAKKFVAGLFAFCLVGLTISSVVTVAIWPGEMKLLAPLFCTDEQPDSFIVSDTSQNSDGETVTNFTMYCMGSRGDVTHVGFAKPFLLVSAIHGLLALLLLWFSEGFGGRGRIGRTRGGPDEVSEVQDVIMPEIIADK